MPLFGRLVNRQEEKAHGELKSVADEYGYVVYLKVRLADVLPIGGRGCMADHLISRPAATSGTSFRVRRGAPS